MASFSNVGNFDLGNPWAWLDAKLEGNETSIDGIQLNSDDELLTIDEAVWANLGLSTIPNITAMQTELQIPALDNLPSPEIPCKAPTQASVQRKRFKSVSEDKQRQYEDMVQSDATKKNTRWGVNILQDWHNETYGEPMDLIGIQPPDMAEKLKKFYCEAKPLPKTESDSTRSKEYHKSSLKNIRAAINRHMSDIGRDDIDIVSDKQFKHANNVLNGLLKERVSSGTSKPTQHKKIINKHDLNKISTYLENATTDPIKLRLGVWYVISFHFVTRGFEFHSQLNYDSFTFNIDENGNEYASLNHETKAKNYQGGLQSEEAFHDKRMYATGTNSCPVKMLKFFLSKTDKNATSLFNRISKDALTNPHTDIWYTTKPLGKTIFTGFMPDICKQARCETRYTAHCLRATAIQAMNDAGVETRHIMYMSGHRNEGSVRSYSRDCSTQQKHSFSQILSSTASGPAMTPVTSSTRSETDPANPVTAASRITTPLGAISQCLDITNTMSANSVQSGFLTNSSFNNCCFNFNMKM